MESSGMDEPDVLEKRQIAVSWHSGAFQLLAAVIRLSVFFQNDLVKKGKVGKPLG